MVSGSNINHYSHSFDVFVSSIYPRHKIDDATLRINDMDAGFQVTCDNHGANSINDDHTFQRQDYSINDGYLPKPMHQEDGSEFAAH